jgi:uncharacterized Zn finger protein (UPF0148 family)
MSRSQARLEEDCPECGHLMVDHMPHEGGLLCPEFILDLEVLRIDAERAVERYQSAWEKSHESR